MFTGENAPELTQSMKAFRGSDVLMATGLALASDYPLLWGSKVPHLQGVSANSLYGAVDTQFHPNIGDDETLSLFLGSVHRTVTVMRKGSDSVHGIDLNRYELDMSELASVKSNKENVVFDQFGLDGFTNQARAAQGVPVALSKPHFLDCDPIAQDWIIGFNRDRDTQDTFLNVEPNFGVSMRGHKRIQINMQLLQNPLNHFGSVFPDYPPKYFPIIWNDEFSEISSSKADEFKTKVYGAKKLIQILPILGTVFACFGASMMILLSFLAQRNAKRMPLDGVDDFSFQVLSNQQGVN